MFEIGEKVRVKGTSEIGIVTDRMFSEAKREYMYIITSVESGRSFGRKEGELEAFVKENKYSFETEIADNVVIVIIYEMDGNIRREACRGHGHIIHDGAVGIAQACSYASRKALEAIDSGLYFKQNRHN